MERHTGGGPSARAVRTVPARRSPREHDLVPHRDRIDRVADVLDDAGAFVPEHHRNRALPLAPDLVQVGPADACGGDAHDDLVRSRVGKVQLDDLERLADGPKQPCPCGEAGHRRAGAKACSAAGAL